MFQGHQERVFEALKIMTYPAPRGLPQRMQRALCD
jgi:hypothetical protein